MRLAFEFDAAALVRGLQRLPGALNTELERCLRSAGRVIATEARSSHDYTDRTGRLTRSILPIAPTGRFTENDLSGGAGAIAPYAGYVEAGTSRFKFRPDGYRYLGLAHALRSREVERLFNDHVEAAVRRAGL
jgi:hypothetical protein